MRGADTFTESLFTMRHLDDFVPTNHPLRSTRVVVNTALVKMDALLSIMCEADIKDGRPSITPEKLLRAMLLQIFYSIRSERQLMKQTRYNLLFRWFIGLAMDDAVWVPTVSNKNRDRLIEHDAMIELFNQVLEMASKQDLLSGEHFSVDGTLIQAWAGQKCLVRKDGSGDGDGGNYKGQTRCNDTCQRSHSQCAKPMGSGCMWVTINRKIGSPSKAFRNTCSHRARDSGLSMKYPPPSSPPHRPCNRAAAIS